MEDGSGNSLLAKEKQELGARRLFLGALGACALISIAIYNGYPTVFSDTGGYLLTGKFFLALPPFRAPGYALFTKITSAGITAWFTVATQSIIVVYVLHIACDYLIEGDRKIADRYFLASVCVMTGLTSLPWLVSLVMPDVFAGVLFLSAFLLAFADDLCLKQRIALAAISMVSVGAHTSLLPIATLFIVALVTLRLLGSPATGSPLPRSVLIWLLVPTIIAGIGTAALNRQMGLGFRLSPSRNSFLLARLFGDGLAADFLRENCPKQDLISCQYLAALPQTQEEFLFRHPLYAELVNGHEDEMEKIVRGTLLAYPFRFAKSSAKQTLIQLASLRTGDEIRSYGAREWNSNVIPLVFPADFQGFINGRQYHDHLVPAADATAAVDTAFFWLSAVTCLLFARTGRFERLNMFFYSAIAYLVINAAICASFAGVFDRYQSRVSWILPFCLTAYVGCLARDWKRLESVDEMGELAAPAE